MKAIVSIAASLVLIPVLFGVEVKTFREHIVKEDLFFIEAESNDTTVMRMTGFLPYRYPKALVNYCESVGGKATVEKTKDRRIDNDNFKDVICNAPDGKGFEARFMQPERAYETSNFQKSRLEFKGEADGVFFLTTRDFFVAIKHESPQSDKHAGKGWRKEKDISEKTKLEDLDGIKFQGVRVLADLSNLCRAKGGEYLMTTLDTQGYAVEYGNYLLYVAKEIGEFKTTGSPGKHWCVNTTNPSDEFSVVVAMDGHRQYVRFLPTIGVDRTQIKISTDVNPSYLFKSKKSEVTTAPVATPVDLSIKASRQPTPPEVDLAKRTLNSKNTVLARTGGFVSEGMYLGQSVEGCERVAVARTGDAPIDHESLYGNASQYQSILNFKQCGNGNIVFAGESVERTIPRSIEPEYKRILGMCKIKGMAMGTYLGYDIDCQRQGSMAEPVYEMSVVKKDKLVGRAYEK